MDGESKDQGDAISIVADTETRTHFLLYWYLNRLDIYHNDNAKKPSTDSSRPDCTITDPPLVVVELVVLVDGI